MKSFARAGMLSICPFCVFCTLVAAGLLAGCGGSDSSAPAQEKQYGSVALGLQFERTAARDRNAGALRRAPAPDICTDSNIDTINVQILWHDGTAVVTVADVTWACSGHGGTIDHVPVGSDYSIVCSGLVDGNPLWQGQVNQVTVTSGRTTQVGTVIMHYGGTDHTPPELLYTRPATGAGGVALNSSIVAVFNEPIAASSVPDELFLVINNGVPVTGRIDFSRSLSAISFTPDEDLNPSATYAVTLDSNGSGGTGIMDSARNVCDQDYSWSFVTGSAVDTRAPQVSATIPGAGAEEVNEATVISVSFDEPLNPGLVNDETMALTSDQGAVSGRTAYDIQTHTLTFTPDESLAYLTDYTVILSSGIQDMAGNLLADPPCRWGFRTMETHLAYTITAAGAAGGAIRPAGDVTVEPGDGSVFEIETDQGTNDAEYLPATDLEGNDRIIGSQVDMGVYER